MSPDNPLIEEPPERDPFIDLLFRDGAAGLFLAALIALLGILALLRWRRRKAAQAEEDGAEPGP